MKDRASRLMMRQICRRTQVQFPLSKLWNLLTLLFPSRPPPPTTTTHFLPCSLLIQQMFYKVTHTKSQQLDSLFSFLALSPFWLPTEIIMKITVETRVWTLWTRGRVDQGLPGKPRKHLHVVITRFSWIERGNKGTLLNLPFLHKYFRKSLASCSYQATGSMKNTMQR